MISGPKRSANFFRICGFCILNSCRQVLFFTLTVITPFTTFTGTATPATTSPTTEFHSRKASYSRRAFLPKIRMTILSTAELIFFMPKYTNNSSYKLLLYTLIIRKSGGFTGNFSGAYYIIFYAFFKLEIEKGFPVYIYKSYILQNHNQGDDLLQDPDKIFNTNDPSIQELIKDRNWLNLIDRNKITRIYDFVKNDIVFGFSKKPLLSASQVLSEGRGYALTKSILLKTLLDACGVLCRFHAFKVKKELYRGLASPMSYNMLPEHLMSAWIEIFYDNQWLVADGTLLDNVYFDKLNNDFNESGKEFIGLGCAVFLDNTIHTEWNGKNHSYCHRAAIARDLGIIEEFDWFFDEFKRDIKQLGKISPKFANRVIHKRRFDK